MEIYVLETSLLTGIKPLEALIGSLGVGAQSIGGSLSGVILLLGV